MDEPELKKVEDVKPIPNIKQFENLSMGDFLSKLTDVTETKDKILSDMSGLLFDEKKLLMIARLDKHLAFYIVKHYVILIYFYKHYIKSEVKTFAVAIPNYPFFEFKSTPLYPSHDEMIKSYENFIEKLLQVTISYDGKGREDVKEIIKALFHEKEKEDERGLRGMLKKYF